MMNPNNNQQQISCPVCNTPIYFETVALLRGEQFTCSGCHASIQLKGESREKANEVYSEFKKMKRSLNKSRNTGA